MSVTNEEIMGKYYREMFLRENVDGIPFIQDWLKEKLGEEINYRNKNKEYWRGIFKIVLASESRDFWHYKEPNSSSKVIGRNKRKAIAYLRQERFIVRNWDMHEENDKIYGSSYDAMKRRYGEKYARAIEEWFARKRDSGEFSCTDNSRVALASSKSECRRYNKIRNNGCCGYYDDVITVGCLFRKSFKVGFNYGH